MKLKNLIFLIGALQFSALVHAQAPTYCNPLNIDYGFNVKDGRHAADPVIVLFKDKYYLFTTLDGIGFRVSTDLVNWKYVEFNEATKALLNLKAGTGYLAPAVATDGQYLYFMRLANPATENVVSKTTALIRTDDPESGNWVKLSEIRKIADPSLLFDKGKIYMYYGLGAPSRMFEVDPKTFEEIKGTDRKIIPDYSEEKKLAGWEEITEGGRPYPIREGLWAFKHDNKYYITYATPGTASKWYSDGVYSSDSPEGPFVYQEPFPAATKPGGFIGSAGHSCIFQDRYGNWLQVTSMWIGIAEQFERRIGIFPVTFDDKGYMHTLTDFGDYPFIMPIAKIADPYTLHTNWNVLTHNKNVKARASSQLAGHGMALAVDESVRTWWSAATGKPGEWFSLDMGQNCRVNAVQINFAEQDCSNDGLTRPASDYHQFKMYYSADNVHWKLLIDKSKNRTSVPHYYQAFNVPVQARYLKIENVQMAAGGKFALRDVRAFGRGEGATPMAVTAVTALRDIGDLRKVKLQWHASPNADGYMVYYGIAGKLYNHFQVTDGSMDTLFLHTLTTTTDNAFFFRVDAYNKNGVTKGKVVQAVLRDNAYPAIKNGIYQIVNRATGKSAGIENDNSVVQKDVANDITQKWLFEIQPDGAYKITCLEGGKVLQVRGGLKGAHTPLEQGNWDGNESQRWYIRYSEKGHIKLLNKNSWYYMETPNGSTKTGQVLQQARYFDFTYQEWELKPMVN